MLKVHCELDIKNELLINEGSELFLQGAMQVWHIDAHRRHTRILVASNQSTCSKQQERFVKICYISYGGISSSDCRRSTNGISEIHGRTWNQIIYRLSYTRTTTPMQYPGRPRSITAPRHQRPHSRCDFGVFIPIPPVCIPEMLREISKFTANLEGNWQWARVILIHSPQC